jgi:hypothetical protein
MIFKQYENGSCDIIFSKEEIKIIKKKQVLHLSDEALRHFGNYLVKIVTEWNMKFNPNIKELKTQENQEIIPDLRKNEII